jgi:hypothetical protein
VGIGIHSTVNDVSFNFLQEMKEGVLQWLLFYVYLDGGMDFVVDYFQGRESYFSHVFSGYSPQCLC